MPEPTTVKYDLLANIVHEGKYEQGTVSTHIHRKVENTWYEVQVSSRAARRDPVPELGAGVTAAGPPACCNDHCIRAAPRTCSPQRLVSKRSVHEQKPHSHNCRRICE